MNLPAAQEANSQLMRKDFGYDYESMQLPDMSPDSQAHKNVLEYVLECAEESRRVTDMVKNEWDALEWNLNSYVPAKQARHWGTADHRPTTIIIPASFAALETFLTYMSSTFFSEPEIYRYRGTGGKKGIIEAALHERLLAKQCLWFQETLKLETMFRDGFTYGFGLVTPTWTKHTVQNPMIQEITSLMEAGLADIVPGIQAGMLLRMMGDEEVLFEGAELQNVHPSNCLLDPSVSINDIQKSEYVGFVLPTNSMQLLRDEEDPENELFNCKYVREHAKDGAQAGHSRFRGNTDRLRKYGSADSGKDTTKRSPVDVVTMFAYIIPSELGLAPRSRPEKWAFKVACDQFVIQAKPLKLNHGFYPVAACAPSSNGYDSIPVSHLATTFGMQQASDFFVRSHIANAAKLVNDMIVFNPAYIEEEDLLNPGPGKLIRLRQAAYGSASIDSFIKQLVVGDVTRGHVQDSMWLIEMLKEGLGTTNITMGNMSGMPDRPTAAGVNASKMGAFSRLAFIARKCGDQALNSLAFQKAYMNLQFLDKETSVSIVGRYEEILREEYGLPMDAYDVQVGPFSLGPNFQIEPSHGAMPMIEDLSAQTEVVKTMLGVEGVPQFLIDRFDFIGMFKNWARSAGFRNLSEFQRANGGSLPMIQPQVVPDEQAAAMAQAGNIVPVGEMG